MAMPNRNTIVLKMIKARGTILLYLVLITLLLIEESNFYLDDIALAKTGDLDFLICFD